MIDKLLPSVESLVIGELTRSMKEYEAVFNSIHEAKGVLEEEIEELQDELRDIENNYKWFKAYVRNKEIVRPSCESTVRLIKDHAIKAACEAIQVAAMAEKTITRISCDRADKLIQKYRAEEGDKDEYCTVNR